MLFKIILLSCLSGIFYRLGGSGKRGNWLDCLRNTKTRDLGIPLIQGGILIWLTLKSPLYGAIRGIFLRHFLVYGLTFGFLTTLPLVGIFDFWKIMLRYVYERYSPVSPAN